MKKIKMGLGFATGRSSFKKVLGAFVNTWYDSREKLPPDWDVSLSLFVSYDLKYRDTVSTDFTNLSQNIVDAFDSIVFMSAEKTRSSIMEPRYGSSLVGDVEDVFTSGYAGGRNAILYSAMKYGMDCLLFLDDDEYPVAVTRNRDSCLWSGQRVLLSHMENIVSADYTIGCHCGYISPIPQIDFSGSLEETDFKRFIEAISNDIINWDSIKSLMRTGGVTYASTDLLMNGRPEEVPEECGRKFISGSNLCVNLTRPERTLPFYNPPGARGEDTFLSTLLRDRKVLKIPCYTFHDGFSMYSHLLDGALPINLAPASGDSAAAETRFLSACMGWVRYKPLLIYITEPEQYDCEMSLIRSSLQDTLPVMADYFRDDRFGQILPEFERYSAGVSEHYSRFLSVQNSWQKILKTL
jgi:hypothetical protein